MKNEECHCPCHSSTLEMKHCAPCCNKCPHCGRNIHPLFWEEHVIQCKVSSEE